MIILKEFTSRSEAEIAKSFLAAQGIESWIESDDHGGLRPALALSQGVQLKIKHEDLERARAALDEVEGEGGAQD